MNHERVLPEPSGSRGAPQVGAGTTPESVAPFSLSVLIVSGVFLILAAWGFFKFQVREGVGYFPLIIGYCL